MIRVKHLFPLLFLVSCLLLSWPVSAADQGGEEKLVYMVLWRGCEEACEAFTEFISGSGLNADIIYRDAAGEKSHFPVWVKEARALKADLVLTWGTSVTLGMAGTLDDSGSHEFIDEIPLVFMIVSDPLGSRIIESYAKTGRPNVTGTRNRPPDEVYVKAIQSYLPTFKKLGMLYNRNEANSVQKVEEILGLTKTMNFEVVALELDLDEDGRPIAEDISTKVKQLKAGGADFVYLGSSSFLRNNQDLFTDAAVASGLPVLSPYENSVTDSNALLSVAARYEDVGRLAGEQALAILRDGKKPGDLPVRSVSRYTYLVNMNVAKRLNLYPSVEILQFAQIVE